MKIIDERTLTTTKVFGELPVGTVFEFPENSTFYGICIKIDLAHCENNVFDLKNCEMFHLRADEKVCELNAHLIIEGEVKMEMYEWLNKEFNRLTEEIEKVQKQRVINQQKRNALARKFHETKVMDVVEKLKVIEETEMLSDKLKDLSHKRRAINEMLKAYYSEK